MNNIYFTGMPGCGKTTLGISLAKRFGKKFIDLDDFIEKKLGMKISEVFASFGEDFFRKEEGACLLEVSKENGVFVSTGGGIVKNAENIKIMKNSGTVIYINTPAENILQNSALLNRPLLKDKNAIFKLYDERRALYENSADFTYDNLSAKEKAEDELFCILEKILNK